MEAELICLDTSVLIDYFRKTRKEKSFLFELTHRYSSFAVSIITEYEIMVGAKESQRAFWEEFFEQVQILPFERRDSKEAVRIYHELKKARKLIDIPDLFIGASAKSNGLSLATLNKKHFSRISALKLITPKDLEV